MRDVEAIEGRLASVGGSITYDWKPNLLGYWRVQGYVRGLGGLEQVTLGWGLFAFTYVSLLTRVEDVLERAGALHRQG